VGVSFVPRFVGRTTVSIEFRGTGLDFSCIALAVPSTAFDILELDGRDLRLEPLVERRRLLARLIRKPRCGLVLNAQFEQWATHV
jgi:hypothetical protein